MYFFFKFSSQRQEELSEVLSELQAKQLSAEMKTENLEKTLEKIKVIKPIVSFHDKIIKKFSCSDLHRISSCLYKL